MDINQYINSLNLSKKEVKQSLEAISWPEHIPYIAVEATPRNKGFNKALTPIIGGAGCVSLIGGIIASKWVFTILGGALLAGSLLMSRNQKPPVPKNESQRVDFDALTHALNTELFDAAKSASDCWNSAINSIHNRINTEIMSAGVSDIAKTQLLSIVSKEYPLLLRTMEISAKLQELAANADLAGMEHTINSFREKCISELENVCKSQITVFEELSKALSKSL